jgi:hypothetical protein
MALGDRLTGWVGANRKPILNSDPGLDLGDLAEAWNPCLRSCFAIPLVSNDVLLGVLSVYAPDPQGLSRRQTRTVSLLASEGLEPMDEGLLEPAAVLPVDAPAALAPGPRPVAPRQRQRAISMTA